MSHPEFWFTPKFGMTIFEEIVKPLLDWRRRLGVSRYAPEPRPMFPFYRGINRYALDLYGGSFLISREAAIAFGKRVAITHLGSE